MIDAEKVTCGQNALAFRPRPPHAKAAMRAIREWVNDGGDVGEADGDGAFGAETNREDHQAMP